MARYDESNFDKNYKITNGWHEILPVIGFVSHWKRFKNENKSERPQRLTPLQSARLIAYYAYQITAIFSISVGATCGLANLFER